MICPYCGSKELIWDYSSGYIICSDCGSVLDRIYEQTLLRLNEGLEDSVVSSSIKGNVKLKPITIRYLELLEKVKNKKRRLSIDSKAFLEYAEGKRPLVKVLTRNYNREVLLREDVRKVINLMKKYPRLNSRTDRAKIAIALIAIRMANKEAINSAILKGIIHDTSLSKAHIRRLIKLVRQEREFLKEVKNVIKTK